MRKLVHAIDTLNERVGQLAGWLILATVLLSAGNALVRYGFSWSSNAMLELQWYLFSAVFLMAGGYALKHDQHVRIDVLSSRLSARTRLWIDVLGTLLFLMPMAALMLYLSWPVFMKALQSSEYSSNASGLILWPARLLVPLGFLLLILQGVAELLRKLDQLAKGGKDAAGVDDGARTSAAQPSGDQP
jgi:TRAP-type mannitol/chloroaromatic compound transport system permease small subunit